MRLLNKGVTSSRPRFWAVGVWHAAVCPDQCPGPCASCVAEMGCGIRAAWHKDVAADVSLGYLTGACVTAPCFTMLHHMEEHETRWFDLWPWAFPFVICGWPMVAPSHPKSPEVHHHGEALQLPLTADAGWHAGWHRAHVLWSWLVSLGDTDRFG
jgi:hypothetical protein